MQAAIEIRGLSVALGHQPVLTDITAKVAAGRIVGLLGPSGAGKTTLIRTILGLQRPTAGEVSVLGLTPGAKALRTQVGYVSQAPSVYPDLTVGENLDYFGSLLGTDKAEVGQVLQDVELTSCRDRLVASLSGGQRARVSLAAALLGSPKVMLLDEPTVGLDPVLRQKLWQQFRRLADDGRTLLISSHVMDEADRCDELLFVRDGRLLAAGRREQILRDTKTGSSEAAFLALATRRPDKNQSAKEQPA